MAVNTGVHCRYFQFSCHLRSFKETFVQENTAEVIFSDISVAENLSGGKAYHSNHLNMKILVHLTSTPKTVEIFISLLSSFLVE